MSLEDAKNIAQIIALVGGGLFFGYKAYTGYLRINLSLAVGCKRERESDNGFDYLLISVLLKKGANGSVTLHDAAARVTYGNTKQVYQFAGIDRSDYNLEPKKQVEQTRHWLSWASVRSAQMRRYRINWEKPQEDSPLLKLVPDEETELSLFCEVPIDATCKVEVAILGRRTNGHPLGQWKASSISVPETSVVKSKPLSST